LIQSRCRGGSEEATATFSTLDVILEKLKDRKHFFKDAMDLDLLGFEENGANEADGEEFALKPLAWHKHGDPDAKRARIKKKSVAQQKRSFYSNVQFYIFLLFTCFTVSKSI
jgi:hypothetical protein